MATDPGSPAGWQRFALVTIGIVTVVTAALVGVWATRDGGPTVEPPTTAVSAGVWITPDELAELPTTGPAWDRVVEYALADWGTPALGDQNSDHDVHTLAGALYAERVGDDDVAARVVEALRQIEEDGDSEEILAVARNLLGYVIAADLIGYRSETFDRWLEDRLTRPGHSRAGIDTLLDSALRDPSNHGSHARASTVAVARYLDDDELVGTIAARFHDWTGRSTSGFVWRELDWQADADVPLGINPPDSLIDGTNVDGVLPEEQRRSGGFRSPAPREPYVWEGLQGAVATAELLTRAGYEPWEWEDRALGRAFTWLYDVNRYPAEGDDRWIPWVVNARYGTSYPTETPTRPGKSVGFTDWTH